MKKAAHAVMGSFHVQLGPAFAALVGGSIKDVSLRDQLQKTFSEHPHDLTIAKSAWPKCSIVGLKNGGGENQATGAGSLAVDIPKFDLFSELPVDLLVRMVSSPFNVLFPFCPRLYLTHH